MFCLLFFDKLVEDQPFLFFGILFFKLYKSFEKIEIQVFCQIKRIYILFFIFYLGSNNKKKSR